jgi:uncharacterized membrane protein
MENTPRNIEWLHKQLPLWKEKGWLAPGGEEALKAYYGPVAKRDTRQLANLAFAVLAALLIGTGIILLFAHNWEDISRPVRAILAVTPLAISLVLAALALRRGSLVLRECAGAANIIALAAAIGLVAQTYHISGDLKSFLLTVTLAALPVILITRSATGLWLYLAGAVWRRWEYYEEYSINDGLALLVFTLMLAAGALLVWRLHHEGRDNAVRWGIFALLLALACGMVPHLTTASLTFSILGIYTALILGCAALEERRRFISRWIWGIAQAGLLIILLIASFRDNPEQSGYWTAPTYVTAHGMVVLMLVINIVLIVRLTMTRKFLEAAWTLAGPILAYCLLLPELTSALFADAYLLGIGVATIASGYSNGLLRRMNGGLAVVGILALMRLFDSDLSFIARGVAFILIGFAFVAANRLLSRQMVERSAR